MKLAALACVLCACGSQTGSAPSVFNKPCNGTPDVCTGGTTCMPRPDILGGEGGVIGCSAQENVCSLHCSTDTDCTSVLGAGHHCETRCIVAPASCVAD